MRPVLAIVAAHPDDETVGAAGLLLSAGRAAVVHLTDGAPRDPRLRPPGHEDRDAYARLRRAEALAALAEAGIVAGDVHALGAVDQEAAGEVARLAREVALLLSALRPRIAVVHPFEGGHPDHDAAAVIARAAASLLARRGEPVPRLVEMTSYHARDRRLERGVFLDGPAGTPRRLPSAHLAAKRRMVARYASQHEVLAGFPLEPERFREAPAIAVDRRPHPGPLHYELQGWASFEAVRDALASGLGALGLGERRWA